MATIYDVARAAGVSPKTVSRVLNRNGPVGEATRAAVEQAIDTLDYVPSNAARTMRSNRSGLIGLITGAISHSAEPTETTGLPDLFIVQGVQSGLSDSARTLMIADTGGRSDTVSHLIRTFAQHRVEGLIYVADYHREVSLDITKANCPVLLANCFDRHGTLSVLPDDHECQRRLVTQLIELGHDRIGFLALDPAMAASRLRLEGYRDALGAAGLAYDPGLVAAAHKEWHDMASDRLTTALDGLLRLDDPPTVICCGNDAMAMRVYGLLRTRGMNVPDDISVAGFDNHRVIAETLHPPLTTVELAYHEIGRRAAAELLRRIEGGAPDHDDPILVSGSVVPRSSVIARTTAKQDT